MPLLCPISTRIPSSFLQDGLEETEVRAYKLGKRRWSYNQVEVVIHEAGGSRSLSVAQAVNLGTDNFNEEYRESAVNYRMDLSNRATVVLHGFLCYDIGEGGTPLLPPARSLTPDQWHQWYLVQRSACTKGCTGPVLRVIQRFGKLGKRAWGAAEGGGAVGAAAASAPRVSRMASNLKDPRFLYLSFDEAGTHVSAKTFRLVVALYDADGCRLLSHAASSPIRVLANNDVPTGAAHLRLDLQVSSGWEGWARNPNPRVPGWCEPAGPAGGLLGQGCGLASGGTGVELACGEAAYDPQQQQHCSKEPLHATSSDGQSESSSGSGLARALGHGRVADGPAWGGGLGAHYPAPGAGGAGGPAGGPGPHRLDLRRHLEGGGEGHQGPRAATPTPTYDYERVLAGLPSPARRACAPPAVPRAVHAPLALPSPPGPHGVGGEAADPRPVLQGFVLDAATRGGAAAPHLWPRGHWDEAGAAPPPPPPPPPRGPSLLSGYPLHHGQQAALDDLDRFAETAVCAGSGGVSAPGPQALGRTGSGQGWGGDGHAHGHGHPSPHPAEVAEALEYLGSLPGSALVGSAGPGGGRLALGTRPPHGGGGGYGGQGVMAPLVPGRPREGEGSPTTQFTLSPCSMSTPSGPTLDDLFVPMHVQSHLHDFGLHPGMERLAESLLPDSPYSQPGPLDLHSRPFQYL